MYRCGMHACTKQVSRLFVANRNSKPNSWSAKGQIHANFKDTGILLIVIKSTEGYLYAKLSVD